MSNKKRIGKYMIFMNARLGAGGFGEVYQGVNETTGEEVAVKVLEKAKMKKGSKYEMAAVKSEIQINKKLKSPHIIKFYDVHESHNNFYIILELATGGTLLDLLKKNRHNGQLQEKKVMKYLIQILNGCGELFKSGIIHRDLKPANILIKDEILKIADFGLAKHCEINAFLKTRVGTLGYMAPQILNKELYTYKCDIWSLGVIVYEMVVGQTPWHFKTQTEEAYKQEIYNRKIVIPENACSALMRDFILGCLCIDEAKRLNWHQVLNHALLGNKFQNNFPKDVKDSTEIGFVIANLRMNLLSKNINLSKILEKVGAKLEQGNFVNMMRFIYKEITSEEIMALYKYLAHEDGGVVIKEFVKLLTLYQCRLTGVDLNGMEIQSQGGSEDASYMLSSKKRIHILQKLKHLIEAKNIDIPKLFQANGVTKNDKFSLPAFGKLISLIGEDIDEQEVQSLFTEFGTDSQGVLTYQQAYHGLCKVAEIVPMEEE